MSAEIPGTLLQSLDETRRSFLSKLIAGSAFAVPSVASFSMSGFILREFKHNFFCSNLSPDCSNIGAVKGNFSGCNIPARTSTVWTSPATAFKAPILRVTGANLHGANLTNADLAGANLRGANLQTPILTNVNDTTCPDGTNSDQNGGTGIGHVIPGPL